jgi:argininosuccinate synthase
MERAIFAPSLDTSLAIVRWLQEAYRAEVLEYDIDEGADELSVTIRIPGRGSSDGAQPS